MKAPVSHEAAQRRKKVLRLSGCSSTIWVMQMIFKEIETPFLRRYLCHLVGSGNNNTASDLFVTIRYFLVQ